LGNNRIGLRENNPNLPKVLAAAVSPFNSANRKAVMVCWIIKMARSVVMRLKVDHKKICTIEKMMLN
jgi:hypothetical protein